MARKLQSQRELFFGLPLFQIWLIRAKDNTCIYIVSKSYHLVCDGLSLLQMFSLMQDGGDEIAKETNRVIYPERCTIRTRDIQNRLKALKLKIGPNTLLLNPTT